MSTPPMPIQQTPPPDPTQGLMGQAQQALNNPMGQPAPQGGGLPGIASHPLIQGILKLLGGGLQTAGWTGQSPQERVERTQLQQNKADTLARLAQTGAYQQGELAYRGNMAGIAQQNADTKKSDLQRKTDLDKFNTDLKQQDQTRKQGDSDIKAALGQGRLDLATQVAKQNVDKFEQNFALAKQKFGDQQARTMMIEQGLGIRQQLANTLGAALEQKGTEQGVNTIADMAKLKAEHPLTMGLLDSLGMGLPDLATMVGKAGAAGIPGTSPAGGGLLPAASASQPNVPANKIQAKQSQRNKPAAAPDGATHMWTPNGIQPIGSQPQ